MAGSSVGDYLSSGALSRMAALGQPAPDLRICTPENLRSADPRNVDRLVAWLFDRGDAHEAIQILETIGAMKHP